ncbi:hypothetical protein DES53_115101 [Roseimicrobium gellanilyticum]|uniref:Uncharacterized protein n=1 Tax=Roseimicrobium gellanilyticum TaxID=748857 RepID=A0A366H7J3_9BACT|nr:hypothetical protein DES53_115101 [Roseimicrobium gellanilyticum]
MHHPKCIHHLPRGGVTRVSTHDIAAGPRSGNASFPEGAARLQVYFPPGHGISQGVGAFLSPCMTPPRLEMKCTCDGGWRNRPATVESGDPAPQVMPRNRSPWGQECPHSLNVCMVSGRWMNPRMRDTFRERGVPAPWAYAMSLLHSQLEKGNRTLCQKGSASSAKLASTRVGGMNCDLVMGSAI